MIAMRVPVLMKDSCNFEYRLEPPYHEDTLVLCRMDQVDGMDDFNALNRLLDQAAEQADLEALVCQPREQNLVEGDELMVFGTLGI